MKTLELIIFYLHILGGGLSLAMGLVALIVKKGRHKHILSGRVFFYSMIVATISGSIMSFSNGQWFLLAVGIFSLYFTYAGMRYLYIISPHAEVKPHLLDWAILFAVLVCALWFSYQGYVSIMAGNMIGIVSIVFSVLALVLGIEDARVYAGRLQLKAMRLRLHFSRMIGAYIATTTAFVVAGLKIYTLTAWLLPTIIGVPIILYWNRKVAGKGT